MNLSFWDIIGPAFFECLILVGIHSYLGLHVIRRKVIFVDLALAQIAALGTTVGFLFGILPGTTGAYWFSLFFTFLGAAVFAIARFRSGKIPQEAIIGITYAIAASLSVLVIDKSPHGAEHIKELLTGSILWVKWKTIATAAVVYAAVGIFHFIFRDKFFLISENPEKAESLGISIRFWDFLFYVSFGIVITHSVGTAGVLLVFVFLVVPAITSMMITDVLWKQLVLGWTMGVIVSVSGLYVSYVADLPSGPAVVVFYGIVLIFVSVALYVKRSENKAKSIRNIIIGIILIVVAFFFLKLMGEFFHKNHLNEKGKEITKTQTVRIDEMSDVQLSKYLASINNVSEINKLFNTTDDELIKIKIASRAIKIDKQAGLKLLNTIKSETASPFVKLKVNEIIANTK